MVTLDESAEQRQFRSSLHSWGERYFDDAAAPASDPAGDIRKLWPELAELGVLALASDPDSGGAAEVVIAAEELGRVACPGPVVASIVAAGALTGETRDLIREGQVIPSLVINSIVPFSGLASVFLKIEDSEIWEVAREATWEPFVTSAGLEWSRGDVRKVRSLGPAAGAQVLRDLGTAAYLVGAAERQLEIAAAYANERKQFGHPIGEFQAVSHPLAAAYVDLLAAKSLTVIAASTFDAGKDARRGALEARIAAANAGLRGAYAAHQAMGGIGFAVEGPLARRSLQLREVALSAPLGAAETELLEGQAPSPGTVRVKRLFAGKCAISSGHWGRPAASSSKLIFPSGCGARRYSPHWRRRIGSRCPGRGSMAARREAPCTRLSCGTNWPMPGWRARHLALE
jgi:hypothetical protein